MGLFLAAVSIATSVTTGVLSITSQYQQNKAEQENMEAMAEIEQQNARRARTAAEQQAIAIEQDAAARERAMRDRNRALLAQNRARIGAGGLDSSGTPLLMEINNAMNMELDVLQERNNAANEAQSARYQGHLNYVNHMNQAGQYGFRSNQYGSAAGYGVAGGLLSTIGQTAQSAASAYYGGKS